MPTSCRTSLARPPKPRGCPPEQLYCAASDGVFVLDSDLRLLARYTPAKASRTRARIPLPMAGSGGGTRKCDMLAVCNELSMIACGGKREEGACFELLDVTRKFGTEAYRLDSINFAGAHEDPRFMSKGLVLGITFGKCWGMRKVKTCYLFVMHETCILQVRKELGASDHRSVPPRSLTLATLTRCA